MSHNRVLNPVFVIWIVSWSVLLRVVLFQLAKALGVTPRLVETLGAVRLNVTAPPNVLWTTIVEQI